MGMHTCGGTGSKRGGIAETDTDNGAPEMRKTNPETGKPYQRKKPMRWKEAFRIVRHRKAHEKLIADGFVECGSFAQLPLTNNGGYKAIDAAVHPDGSRLYVKMEAGWYAERDRAKAYRDEQQQAWRNQYLNPAGNYPMNWYYRLNQ